MDNFYKCMISLGKMCLGMDVVGVLAEDCLCHVCLMTGGGDASSLLLSAWTKRAAGRSSSCPLKHKSPVVFGSHVPAGGLNHI